MTLNGWTIKVHRSPLTLYATPATRSPTMRFTEEQTALRDSLRDEVPSTQIGDLVMRRIRDLDEVAYVRFASVYKEFQDLISFLRIN